MPTVRGMSKYPRYTIEVVPCTALCKGDRLLHIGKAGAVFELELASLLPSTKVYWLTWPINDCRARPYPLGGYGATHLRLVRDNARHKARQPTTTPSLSKA
jgi:hypothetical protein